MDEGKKCVTRSFACKDLHGLASALLNTSKEVRLKIYALAKEDVAKLSTLSSKMHEESVKDIEAKGLPGKAVYYECRRLIKKYTK